MNLDQICDIPDILMEFLEYHSTVRGHSDRTVAAYYMDLKILLRYLKRRRRLVPRDTPFNEIDIEAAEAAIVEQHENIAGFGGNDAGDVMAAHVGLCEAQAFLCNGVPEAQNITCITVKNAVRNDDPVVFIQNEIFCINIG